MRPQGFTLIELLVALAILAIISAVAMPIYTQYSIRTFRADAQKDLMTCAQGLERAASRNFSYAMVLDTDADGVGDASTGAVTPNICTPTTTLYDITVQAADASTFTLRATPTGGTVVDDGMLEIDGSGARRWDENNNGAFGDAGEDDWKD